MKLSLPEKESVFGVFLVRIFPHSDWIWENTNHKNYEYGHFSRSVCEAKKTVHNIQGHTENKFH